MHTLDRHASAAFARELIVAFAELGVEDYVLSPGSRSGPLAHALADSASSHAPLGAPRTRLHVRIDERSAGFWALGLARGHALNGEPRPVVVVTTSGSAVGHLFPAVMEAHHSGVPIIVVTADRPGELQGVGANQTTDQSGIFGTFVRWSSEVSAPEPGESTGRASQLAFHAAAAALGDSTRDDMASVAGPVHLNIEFRDPLTPGSSVWPEAVLPSAVRATGPSAAPQADTWKPLERSIVVAGDQAGEQAVRLAEQYGWPLLAEPTSRARKGPNAIANYLSLLDTSAGTDLVQGAHQVIVVGRPTLSRPIQRLMAAAPSLIVAGHGALWREAPHQAERVLPCIPDEWFSQEAAADRSWLASWREASASVGREQLSWGAQQAAHTWLQSLSRHDVALIGASGAIRALDRVAPSWPHGQAPVLLASRGLSGIDGSIATASGISLAMRSHVHALVGDVTFLHDVGSLLVGPLEERPQLTITVLNDGGGTIFSRLEHGDSEPEILQRVFTTPHGADLAALCAGYGVEHQRVSSAVELKNALSEPGLFAISTVRVVEAML